MKVYQVFKHPEKGYEAVKRGFSWPAFFFCGFWAFGKKMWGTGLWLTVSLLAILSVGLVPTIPGNTDRYWPLFSWVLFAFFAGRRGNTLWARSLESRGYLMLGAMNARDDREAVSKVATAGGIIPPDLKASARPPGLIAMPKGLQGLNAIIALTWKAAFRYKLFWVIMVLLLGAVIGLPLILKHDGTAEGLAQILITYTLGIVTVLLGLCTLWLACGTLARDVEECQIQMVAVKPIPRWQIWLGKWIGLVSLNAALLCIVGVSLYSLLLWRSRGLSGYELAKLQTQVLVARASAYEQNVDKYVDQETERRFNDQLSKSGLGGLTASTVKKQISDQVRAELQSVSPNHERRWVIHVGKTAEQLHDEPLYLRVKFNVGDSSQSKTYAAFWRIDDPAQNLPPYVPDPMSFTADSFHEFPVPSELLDANGNIEIRFANENPETVLFPLSDGMEVLYREGGFALNLARGLAVILCWMGFFAALGLAAASFLSFPVAAFCSLAILSIGLSSGTLSSAISEGSLLGMDQETGQMRSTFADGVMLGMFKGILKVIHLVQDFSPVDSLSTGRSVSWPELARAVAQVVLLLGGILALFGIFVFNRRELATAQGTQ